MNFEYPDLFYTELESLGFGEKLTEIKNICRNAFSTSYHGDFDKWQSALSNLPQVTPSIIDLARADIGVGQASDFDESQIKSFVDLLKQFHPWRKGPFNLFGQHIDTEWRSDWKWDRVVNGISSLAGRRVLDIGCGSGYHCWRMRAEGAGFVLGIDPTLLFVMQFLVLQRYIQDQQVTVLPLGMDDIGGVELNFDTVFSMGLLYHRRDPQEHLRALRHCLAAHGELVLETLVIEDQHALLIPEGRYAQMRNVWSIPGVVTLEGWLVQAGYKNIRCIDITVTTIEEQRRTDWMQFQSLADFLDPNDQSKTVEGHPAPVRAVMVAEK